MGSSGHPYMDGKKRKGDGGGAVVLLSMALLSLVVVSTDLLDKYTLVTKYELTEKSTKKEMDVKEKKLVTLEAKYEKVSTELGKLDTLLYRKELDFKELEEDKDELQRLYRTLFTKYEKLKEREAHQCRPGTDIDLDNINDRLNRIRGND